MMVDDVPYVLVDLEQGTPEWHAWRKEGIGASEASTILGVSRWESAKGHLLKRCGMLPKRASTTAMRRGTALEPEARLAYVEHIGEVVVPMCVQSKQRPWMRASLDGMTWDGTQVVEIKCGQHVYREASMFRRVPLQYVGQVQHILAVTGLPGMDFWCYWPGREPVLIPVSRDDLFIRMLIAVEEEFWERLQGGWPPLNVLEEKHIGHQATNGSTQINEGQGNLT